MEQVSHLGSNRRRSALSRLPRHRRIVLSLLTVVHVLIYPALCQAAEDSLEYQVKSAFLLNFVKFIEWPASAFQNRNSPINVCILGEDPFGRTLDRIVSGEVVDGRRVTVERIKRTPPPKSCQVVFLSKPEKADFEALGPGVLSVGEGESFTRAGGMIAFVIEDRRVRFLINQSAAERAGLKISSKLLAVAISVKE